MENGMQFDMLSLGDHLPDPHTGEYSENQTQRYQMWADLGVAAEKLGFSRVLFGEHHGSDYICPAPQMVLASIAGRTNRIGLGTAVSLLPNIDPLRVAEDFAILDALSNGRAEIGFGSGFTEDAFRLFGQDMADSDALAAENLALIEKLWREKSVTWSGRFRASLENFHPEPRTVSGRPIPISRATAGSIQTAEAAARAGHKLMLFTAFGDFSRVRPIAAAYREAFQRANHLGLLPSVAVVAYVHVRPDNEEALAFWKPYATNYRSFTARLADRGMTKGVRAAFDAVGEQDRYSERPADFVGSPAAVIDKIGKADEEVGGFDHLMCYFDVGGLSRRHTEASMELFAHAVMPHFLPSAI